MTALCCWVLCSLGQVAPEPFVVQTTQGPQPASAILAVQNDWSLRTDKGDVAGKDLISIRHAALPLPALVEQNFLWLNSGDRIPLQGPDAWRLEQDRLYFLPGGPLQGKAELSLSANYAAVLWLEKPASLADPELFLRRFFHETRPRDVILLRNGDRVEGVLKGLTAERILRLEVNAVETRIPLAHVAGIAFNTDLQARPRIKGPFGHAVLAGGGRVSLTSPSLSNSVLRGKLAVGGFVEVPLDQVRAIDMRQGAAVYLSDLKPKSYEFTPFLSLTWPLVTDAGVTGRPLRAGSSTHDKGLGMHTRSKVVYALSAAQRWFETTAALAEGQRGHARVRILVDGQEKATLLLTPRSGPIPVRVDVAKGRELTLIADFADLADIQAHVNWLDARLIAP